ncbi:MAG TPA: alpha/beta fold hydrolase [Gemmatimonadales bacterium]|nr:alpha/beta fold hydrolase [Gemmatimonadales bacterium]
MLTAMTLTLALMAAPDTVRTVDVTIPGPVPLPAKLTLPAGEGPFPAVVIVHGSGAGDMDGTLGPNKPYVDLARGLADRGVAVLRYDKRAKANGLWYLNRRFTVYDETIEDARSAVAVLRTRAEIVPSRIVIAGHSLGGFLAPRIVAGDSTVAGVILLAGAYITPLDELIPRQVDYIISVSDSAGAARGRAQRAALGAMMESIRRLTPADSAQPGMIMGAPASYWLDLRGYDPTAVARTVPQPMLILQGERDYQVTPAMLDEYVARLGERPRTTVRRFPGLNHLFIRGEGTPRPAEYAVPGHVAAEVMEVMAEWVKGLAP